MRRLGWAWLIFVVGMGGWFLIRMGWAADAGDVAQTLNYGILAIINTSWAMYLGASMR